MATSSNPGPRTFLCTPDGKRHEYTGYTAGSNIRKYREPGETLVRFVIDGRRYKVASASELPYVPGSDGPVRMIDLVEVGPPAN